MWEAAEMIRLPEPAGLARLVRPQAAAPLVVILPDALGDDGRAEPYVDSLLARGIATLTLGLGEAADAATTPTDPAAAPAAIAPALAWARATGFDAARLGVLGFGLGGRAALAGAEGVPAVALYPGCAVLPDATGPALVLMGEAACPSPPATPLTLRLIPGAGHAWDAPGALWPSPGPALPDPAGGPRLPARADHAVTLLAAEAIADWFEMALAAPATATAPAAGRWNNSR